MSSPIPSVYKSIIRAITDFIDEVNEEALHGTVGYHNWESRGDENKLPQMTLIGTDGFTFDENAGRWLIRFALAVSSYRDFNNLEEIELIGKIHEHFGESKKINHLSEITGEIENELLISTFKVMPMAQSEIRNYRTIGLELLRTGT